MIINNIDYHITEKCNKNCNCCGHFIPLAPSHLKHKTVEDVKSDLRNLLPYTDYISNISLTGGEPTLNPDLGDILLAAVELFPNKITLVSNCLLPNKIEEVKQIIIDNNIKLMLTNYNNGNTEKIVEMFDNTDVDIRTFHIPSLISENGEKQHFFKGFLTKTRTVSEEMALECEARQGCMQLVGSKLYICQYAAYFKYFDEYFKGEHKIHYDEDSGYLDLSQQPTVDELFKFKDNHICNLCYHCVDCLRMYGKYDEVQPIGRTEKKIDEWLVNM